MVPAAIIVAVILNGSFYPFRFQQPEGDVGPLRHLIQSWTETPDRGDFVANIFFYLPLGYFGNLALAESGRRLARILLITLAGGLLSTAMDALNTISQSGYPPRTTSMPT